MLEVGRMSPCNNRSAIAFTTRAFTAFPKALYASISDAVAGYLRGTEVQHNSAGVM